MPAKVAKNRGHQAAPAAPAHAEHLCAAPPPTEKPAAGAALPESAWKLWHSWALLGALVLLALLPFSGRAFHIDDTLFVFAGKHIAQQPLNPYGFVVNWDDYDLPFAQITKNPPLACYYIAVVGWIAGWSERVLHLAFLVPALVFVLGTFYLARRFTQTPLLAALATFAAPAYLVSSASVMCDAVLVAAWLLAMIFWLEGLDKHQPVLLGASGLLMGAAALIKYFGVSLIPLLLAYTLYRERRAGRWLFYFLIPIGVLAAYQGWTKSLYGEGLLFSAADFANSQKENTGFAAETLEGLSFLGGCVLPVVAFAPWLWSKLQIAIGLAAGAVATAMIASGFVFTGRHTLGTAVGTIAFQAHPILFSLELTLFIAGGISALALAATDFRLRRDANSLLLLLWMLGTFVFACYFNWTVNARSILPLLPAVGLLISRRLRQRGVSAPGRPKIWLAAPLFASTVVSVWVLMGDSQLANAGRQAALRAKEMFSGLAQTQEAKTAEQPKLWFIGHWGLQYYMEQINALPANRVAPRFREGDFLLIPANSTSSRTEVGSAVPREVFDLPISSAAITINRAVGAGFYSSYWGPLPFFLGPVPPERYTLAHLVTGAADD